MMTPPILHADASAADQSRIAGSLANRGLRVGDRFALSLPGSTTYLSTVLGALRAGFVPVPLDPRLTAYERDRILADVGPTLVVDDQNELESLARGPSAELADHPLARPMHMTSGTTGKPKGVWSGILSPEHAGALVTEERDLWGFTDADVNLVVSPIYHSAPLRFAMGTLLAGGSVAVMDHFDAQRFVEAVDDIAPTTMFCVPAHLQRLFAWLDESGRPLDASSFRLVAHAGAPCPDPIRLRTHDTFGLDVVWEFYGSTEGQFTACPAAEWQAHPGTLGHARPGRIVTADDKGLLWCEVPEHARFEYWNDPVKTAEAWKGSAFTVGDLGRVEDGYVYLDSRREDLIISGGVNIYPAEVEAALADATGLVDIAVFGRQDEQWGQRVCAAYVGDVSVETLEALAEERLAPPKRPKDYKRFDALPRTATGKVRRTELG
ncbi:MAG: AMP-binding protein [Actinomycetota bacterium]|nr:AMP-binding protein [Actinomycetota bacterium]